MNWPNRTNTDLARSLRNNVTDAERHLWAAPSTRKIAGVRFNRQVCIGPYICDFVARTPRVIIEVDGGQHADSEADELRDKFLTGRGYRILRFWNHDVLSNIEAVVGEIEQALSALPHPLPQAGGEHMSSTA